MDGSQKRRLTELRKFVFYVQYEPRGALLIRTKHAKMREKGIHRADMCLLPTMPVSRTFFRTQRLAKSRPDVVTTKAPSGRLWFSNSARPDSVSNANMYLCQTKRFMRGLNQYGWWQNRKGKAKVKQGKLISTCISND